MKNKIQWTSPISKQIKSKKVKKTYKWSLRTIVIIAIIGFLLLLIAL